MAENKIPDPQQFCDEVSPLDRGNAIVISAKRFDSIRKNINKYAEYDKEAEEERKFVEYLKKGNDELVQKFGSNCRTTGDQAIRHKELMEQKSLQKLRLSQEMFELVKANEEVLRKQKVAAANEFLEKMRSGPRELRSAALYSEVLRARHVQQAINEEFEKAVRKQECADMVNIDKQGMVFIKEEQQRISEHVEANNNYKRELLDTIGDMAKDRTEQKKLLIKEQQENLEIIDQEIKGQIEKEKAAMEKKRALLRQNALEAMKMVEQRRQRKRLGHEADDRLTCVYNTGKRQLNEMQAETKKKLVEERKKVLSDNAKIIEELPKREVAEMENLRRDISRNQLQFTAEEQEKIRREKAAKQARIEAYLAEVQLQKEANHRKEELRRFEFAQRLKNSEVNCLFNEAEKQKQRRHILDYRAQLNEQTEQRRLAVQAEREQQRICEENQEEKQHKYFFKYAHTLMEDAKKKERPLYPLVKVVNDYKRTNQINCERKLPRHMVSNVNVGYQQYNNAKCQYGCPQKRYDLKTKPATNDDKESILANCLKINQLVASVAGGGLTDRKVEAKRTHCGGTGDGPDAKDKAEDKCKI